MTKEFKQIIIFFIMTLGLTFLVFWGPLAVFKIPAANFSSGETGPIWAIILFILGGFVPSVVGIILTRIHEGKDGVKRLFKSSIQLRIETKWYILMILIPLYYGLGKIVIGLILGNEINLNHLVPIIITFIPLLILGPLSEEYGWRGYALKRLLKITSPNISSLVLGIIWSLWHLPLFYIVGSNQYVNQLPFLPFLFLTTSTAFIYTYLFIKTKYNLFTAIFLHWVYTYIIDLATVTVERSKQYNYLEYLPAVPIFILFIYLNHRVRREKLSF